MAGPSLAANSPRSPLPRPAAGMETRAEPSCSENPHGLRPPAETRAASGGHWGFRVVTSTQLSVPQWGPGLHF